jgi:O-antigen ligase
VNPILSSNSVGALGMTLLFWSIARVRWPLSPNRLRPPVAYGLATLGLVTLFVAQYRTGYVALLVTMAVLLMIRRKWLIASLLVSGAMAFVLWNPSVVTKAEPYVLRGQTVEQARGLSERVDWWGSAIRVWGSSPVIGKGLLTATRFEVLAPLGQLNTSTIHSTWIEALVGTGVIGLSLLGLAYLIVMKRAFVEAVRGALPFALILLTTLSIRTITGNSFESFSFDGLLFLLFALHLQDHRAPRPP